MTAYRVILRDRETETVVGYFNGSWTTDGRRALTLHERKAAEAHAARMRDRCPRNADLIKVEELPPQISTGHYTRRYFAPRGARMRPMIPALAIVLAQAAQPGISSTSDKWCFDRGQDAQLCEATEAACNHLRDLNTEIAKSPCKRVEPPGNQVSPTEPRAAGSARP